MQFSTTDTYLNLAKAFAGEAQAGLRYQFSVATATAQGYFTVADTIRHIAKNETNHAKVFFDLLLRHAGSKDNIPVQTGYPFHAGDLAENMRLAAKDEAEESGLLYPRFAVTAREEGLEDVALAFEQIAKIEAGHQKVFTFLYEGLKNGSLFKSDSPVVWVCSECGHTETALEAWNICPVCGQSQGYVKLHLPRG